ARRTSRLRSSPRCPSAYIRRLPTRPIRPAARSIPTGRPAARLLSTRSSSDGLLQPATRSLSRWSGSLSSSTRPLRTASPSGLLSPR
ncbi:hypothetical protein FOC4_g10012026, partial [Fusarium odoratissimum]